MPKKRLQYRYSSTGQRSLLIDPDGGRFTYSYDSVRRLTQVLNPEGQRTTFAYDNAGRRTVKVLASGSRTSFTYDLANRLTTVAQLKSDASVQAKYEYKYDKAGNRTGMAETGHTTARTTWSYDAAYQLTGEHRTGANAFRNTFTYDTRGNRTLKNLDGVRTTSSYDDANQLKWTDDGSGRTTYTFDADGNQQVVLTPAGQRTTSVWDYENKLVGVLNPSGTRETMAYDPDGRRVKHQATDTVKYVWDGENYLQETDASNVAQATYTNEPRTYGNLISQRKSSATHYYVFEALGSTRLLTDSSEAVAESLLYDAWGNLVGSAPTMAVPFRWVGELGYLFVPSTGDYSVRARILRPSIGRWISMDPIGFGDGLNIYNYAHERPITISDPSGRLTQETVFTETGSYQVSSGGTTTSVVRCGARHWQTRWVLGEGEVNGLIIQKVRMCWNNRKCAGGVPRNPEIPPGLEGENKRICRSSYDEDKGQYCLDYYEMWRAKDGVIYTGSIFDNPTEPGGGFDNFLAMGFDPRLPNGNDNCSFGSTSVAGEAVFVPDDIWLPFRDRLVHKFYRGSKGVKPAVSLYSACKGTLVDNLLDGMLGESLLWIRKTLSHSWNCCDDPACAETLSICETAIEHFDEME